MVTVTAVAALPTDLCQRCEDLNIAIGSNLLLLPWLAD